MPLLKHAKKKQRQDKKRTIRNKKIKESYKSLVKEAKVNKTAEAVQKAYSGLDIAAKEHIIHANKAGRLKSALSKLLGQPAAKPEVSEKKVVKAKQSTSSSPVKKPARTAKKKSSAKK